MHQVMDHDTVLFFAPDGIVRSLKAYQIPQSSRTAAGSPISQARKPPLLPILPLPLPARSVLLRAPTSRCDRVLCKECEVAGGCVMMLSHEQRRHDRALHRTTLIDCCVFRRVSLPCTWVNARSGVGLDGCPLAC